MSKGPVRVLMVSLGLAGAGFVAGCDLRPNTLEDGLSRPDAISEIRIAGGSGNVTIVGDSTTGVEVRRIARYRTAKPGQTMTVAGGTLNLDTNCGVDCSASYEVRVGRGVRVTGRNDSGNVTMRGVSDVDVQIDSGNIEVDGATGTVTLRADSGNIEMSDVASTVRVTVSSGNIEGRNLRGAQTVLETDSGSIDVSMPGTGDLTASANSGNVQVRLPDRCCRILTSADSGRVDMDVQQDPASTHLVDLKTDSGNIDVRAA
jgi:Putative adhesin